MTAPSPVSLVFFPVSGTNFAVADPSISGGQNQPIIQPVSGLVLFTPRLQRGTSFWIDNYLVQAEYSAEQTVNIINNPNQGNWTLQILGVWTTNLAWNAANATVQNALVAAAGVTTADIHVATGINPQSYDVTFTGALANRSIPIMLADPGTLQNALGQGCEVTVDGTSTGGAQIIAPTAITIPPLQARIWNGVLSTIDQDDTPGFQLVANQPELGLFSVTGLSELIYDVTFNSVTYNGGPGILAPWAFAAPTDATPVCLTDPSLDRLSWQPPISTTWTPPIPGLTLVREQSA
jgi:hypothetical protein